VFAALVPQDVFLVYAEMFFADYLGAEVDGQRTGVSPLLLQLFPAAKDGLLGPGQREGSGDLFVIGLRFEDGEG
jgi:hypothetical protein